MKFLESTGPSGRLTIYKKHDTGQVEKFFEEDNLIVTAGRSILLNQLYYTSGSGDPLRTAKVGTGGATDVNGLFLKTPTTDLVDLYAPVASTSIYKADQDLSIPSITLVANVDNSIANGLSLNEAGFFSQSGVMFNIKTFPTVLKKSSFALILEWKIKML